MKKDMMWSMLHYLIFTLLGFIIYFNVLSAPFILDDELYIINNYRLRSLSNFLDFSGTRYIGFLSFAINYYFGGLNTFGYHLVNILIHILNAILVYFLVSLTLQQLRVMGRESRVKDPKPTTLDSRPLTQDSLIAFTVSLIFLVHPMQTQAVSYTTQRFTSLATFFYLLAVVLYVKWRQWAMGNRQWEKPENSGSGKKPMTYSLSPIAYCLSLISTVIAMKTKEISFTLPFIILLYEFTFFNSRLLSACSAQAGTTLNSRLKYLLPYLLTLTIIPTALYLPVSSTDPAESVRQLQTMELATLSKYEYLLTQFKVILTYIRLLIFPIKQNLWYDYPLSNSIFEPAVLLSFISLLFIFAAAIYLFIKSQKANNDYGLLISFGILWFFITLSVESSIIPIKDVIFEHRVYLPSIGFILSLTAAILYIFDYLGKRIDKPLRNYFLFIILIIAAIFSFSTHKRNILWRNNHGMWSDVTVKSPSNAVAHLNLGNIYLNQGRFDEAVKEYQTSLKIKPDYIEAHNNLGFAYYNHGRMNEAIEEYTTALKIKPDYPEPHINIGNIYLNQGRLDEAGKEYQTALKIKPDHTVAHFNLGNIYLNQGRFDEAVKEYQTSLKIKPDYIEAHNNLGFAYYNHGRMNEAIEEYTTALKIKPDYPEAHSNFGNAYLNQSRLDEAKREYLAALKIKPDNAEAHNNLGLIYFKQGHLDDAGREFLAALKIESDYPEAHNNLGLIYFEQGHPNEARKEFETALKLKPDFINARKALELLK